MAEAGDKKGLLPHLKPGAVTHFLPELLNPFSLFSPSSLKSGSVQIASCPWPGAQTPDRDRDREHEPKNTPGTLQPCGSLQARPGHEAVILFMGTHGAWMLCGS